MNRNCNSNGNRSSLTNKLDLNLVSVCGLSALLGFVWRLSAAFDEPRRPSVATHANGAHLDRK